MKRIVDIVCPFCEHKQRFQANSDKSLEVTTCSTWDHGPGDIKEQSGCQKQFLVKTTWSVEATVAKIVWPENE